MQNQVIEHIKIANMCRYNDRFGGIQVYLYKPDLIYPFVTLWMKQFEYFEFVSGINIEDIPLSIKKSPKLYTTEYLSVDINMPFIVTHDGRYTKYELMTYME